MRWVAAVQTVEGRREGCGEGRAAVIGTGLGLIAWEEGFRWDESMAVLDSLSFWNGAVAVVANSAWSC